jgi:hypothetical protein
MFVSSSKNPIPCNTVEESNASYALGGASKQLMISVETIFNVPKIVAL